MELATASLTRAAHISRRLTCQRAPARTKLQQSEEVNRHARAAQKAAAGPGDRPLKTPLLSNTTKAPLPAYPHAGSGSAKLIKLQLSAEGVVKLARAAANEDSRVLRPVDDGGTAGSPTEDTLAIAQTVDAWARWRHTSHLLALERLAPHVAGRRPAQLRRHLVFASLPAYGSVQPAAWLPRDGAWAVYGKYWVAFRDAVRMLARDGFVAPCKDGQPIAYGNDVDSSIALRRGLRRLACGDTSNFWALPRTRTVDASLASAVRR